MDVWSFYFLLFHVTVPKFSPNEPAQIKVLEIDTEDDGWYPAKVYLTKPYREVIGIAESAKQLRTLIENAIKSDFVKKQIRSLLKE